MLKKSIYYKGHFDYAHQPQNIKTFPAKIITTLDLNRK